GAGVLAGVDVHDGHRLGPVDHEVTAGGQEDLPVQALEDLLVDAVLGEDVGRPGVPAYPRHQIWRDVCQVRLDLLVRLCALDHELAEVLIEQIAYHADEQIRLGRE